MGDVADAWIEPHPDRGPVDRRGGRPDRPAPTPPGRREGAAVRRTLLLVLLPLASCAAYDPRMMGTHPATQYEADLDACRTTSREAVRLNNAKFVLRWIGSLYSGPGEVRTAIRQCMEGKGYAVAGR